MGLVTDIWQIGYGNLIKKALLHKMEKQGNRENGILGGFSFERGKLINR